MKKLSIAAGIAVLVITAAAVLLATTGAQDATRTVKVGRVKGLQTGGASLTIVQDDRNELVVRTTRRTMPWVMVRQTGDQLEIGYTDDADPRALLGLLGVNPPSDRLEFELHTSSIARVLVADGGTLTVGALSGRAFSLESLSDRPCVLNNVNVGALDIMMSGTGSVAATGKARSLGVVNSGDGDFLGAGLLAETADVKPGGQGKTIVNLAGRGALNYPGLE